MPPAPYTIQSMHRLRLRRTLVLGGLAGVIVILVLLVDLSNRASYLYDQYRALHSPTLVDRHGAIISQERNARGHYHTPVVDLPEHFENALLQKEDRWFYYHPGINPGSIVRALFARSRGESRGGASTITQQLVKLLLAQETERTIGNKLRELYYTLALELTTSKQDIARMYANTVYLGNQTQGFASASALYFDSEISKLSEAQWARLLATLARPSARNPWTRTNATVAEVFATQLGLAWDTEHTIQSEGGFVDLAAHELSSMDIKCTALCHTTIDLEVTRTLRAILARHLAELRPEGANSGAIVVLRASDAEILSIIGSPDPYARHEGASINMALEPRPVGSTIKPLLYLKGFQAGLRPYTLVDDAEYVFPIATGYSLYPRNFDGRYRGEVTLHYALANSLNVPSVKVLEYIGLDAFYRFLEDDLSFSPVQPLETYQYGIALGGLEMDLLTLTHYLSVIPAHGVLNPLSIQPGLPYHSPHASVETTRTIAEQEETELVAAIMSDRVTAVDQFGLSGNLQLSRQNYGVKTGTSRDYHDSWVVGFTPDLVVGVWLGNTTNTPLARLTGQSGAGRIWRDVMEYLFTTPHYTTTPLSTKRIETFALGNSQEFGLPGDDRSHTRALLHDSRLIRMPHDGDQFLYTPDSRVPLRASHEVDWFINDVFYTNGMETGFRPPAPGTYRISARDGTDEETITIRFNETTEPLPHH